LSVKAPLKTINGEFSSDKNRSFHKEIII
jgi:hypothetical protein